MIVDTILIISSYLDRADKIISLVDYFELNDGDAKKVYTQLLKQLDIKESKRYNDMLESDSKLSSLGPSPKFLQNLVLSYDRLSLYFKLVYNFHLLRIAPNKKTKQKLLLSLKDEDTYSLLCYWFEGYQERHYADISEQASDILFDLDEPELKDVVFEESGPINATRAYKEYKVYGRCALLANVDDIRQLKPHLDLLGYGLTDREFALELLDYYNKKAIQYQNNPWVIRGYEKLKKHPIYKYVVEKWQ